MHDKVEIEENNQKKGYLLEFRVLGEDDGCKI